MFLRKEQYAQYTRLKNNAFNEIFLNNFKTKSSTPWLKRYVTSWYVTKICYLHGCLQYNWYRKKKIWDLDLSGSLGYKFLRPFESKYEYCTFLYEIFSFYKKIPSAFDHAGFFPKYIAAPHSLQLKWYFN